MQSLTIDSALSSTEEARSESGADCLRICCCKEDKVFLLGSKLGDGRRGDGDAVVVDGGASPEGVVVVIVVAA